MIRLGPNAANHRDTLHPGGTISARTNHCFDRFDVAAPTLVLLVRIAAKVR